MNRPSATHVPKAERWSAETGAQPLLRLEVAPHATRERTFDIHCAITVRLREDRRDAWHRMAVLVDGRLEWERRVTTANPGATDDLEVHFRRRVPIGEALRLLVRSEVGVTQRERIVIEVEEAAPPEETAPNRANM